MAVPRAVGRSPAFPEAPLPKKPRVEGVQAGRGAPREPAVLGQLPPAERGRLQLAPRFGWHCARLFLSNIG